MRFFMEFVIAVLLASVLYKLWETSRVLKAMLAILGAGCL